MAFLRRLGDALSWQDDRVAPGRLCAHRHAADPADARSEHRLLLPRSPERPSAVPPRGRHDLEHQPRTGRAVGAAHPRQGRGTARPVAERAACSSCSRTARRGAGKWRAPSTACATRTCRSSSSGVGTLAGDWLPEVEVAPTEEPAPHAISRLNRASLQRIAERAGGQYFELDRDPDRDIANAIVDAGRRLAPPREAAPTVIEYYPRLLTAAVALRRAGAALRPHPQRGVAAGGAGRGGAAAGRPRARIGGSSPSFS